MSSSHLVLAIGALAVASTLSHAQKPVTFNNLSSSYVGNPNTAYSVDVSNDGRPDVIQDFPEYPGIFLVTLNNGDGTFAGTRSYSMPGVDTPYLPMAFGDFNRDGKVDIAVAPAGGPTVYVFLGVGDGTFQQPPKSIPIPLPSGQQFGAASIAAADFNHDGKLDLVVTTTNGSNPAGVWVLPGDGAGGFTSPLQIFSAPVGQWLNDVLELVEEVELAVAVEDVDGGLRNRAVAHRLNLWPACTGRNHSRHQHHQQRPRLPSTLRLQQTCPIRLTGWRSGSTA